MGHIHGTFEGTCRNFERWISSHSQRPSRINNQLIRWGCCSWNSEWYFCRRRRRPTSVTLRLTKFTIWTMNLKFCIVTSRERHTVRFIEHFIYPIFLSKPRRPYISNLPSVIVWSLCEETTRRQSEMRYKNKAQSIIYEILFATGFPSSKLQHGQRRRYLRTYSIFRPREYVDKNASKLDL